MHAYPSRMYNSVERRVTLPSCHVDRRASGWVASSAIGVTGPASLMPASTAEEVVEYTRPMVGSTAQRQCWLQGRGKRNNEQSPTLPCRCPAPVKRRNSCTHAPIQIIAKKTKGPPHTSYCNTAMSKQLRARNHLLHTGVSSQTMLMRVCSLFGRQDHVVCMF